MRRLGVVLCHNLAQQLADARLLSAAAKNSAWTFTATTRARAQLTQVQPRRTTGWCPYWGRCSARPDTRYGPNMATASAGQRRSDVEIWNYLRSQAGSQSLVFDLSIAHDRFGSSSHVQQNGCLSHPQDLDEPLRIAAQRWWLSTLQGVRWGGHLPAQR
jgi:hypothetical protein